MMLEWSDNGKRYRVSAKTRSWAEAEQRARARMADAHARTVGEQPKAGQPISLDRAVEMFNPIYEADFHDFSYGFRPGRSPHQALDALSYVLLKKKVNYVLDADIRGFFR
jgi:hypothetical protein